MTTKNSQESSQAEVLKTANDLQEKEAEQTKAVIKNFEE